MHGHLATKAVVIGGSPGSSGGGGERGLECGDGRGLRGRKLSLLTLQRQIVCC